jgi:hypothetical protein
MSRPTDRTGYSIVDKDVFLEKNNLGNLSEDCRFVYIRP